MAASIIIEEETGTYTRTQRHPHNGYYAGDFSNRSRPDGFERALLSSQRPVAA
ncbi:MAG TPA: hypothetical protein VFK41_02050 [Nocardioidaceae bacterium]|nr:hypothetical protein [Nocardioidaceae bacterium]